MSSVTEPPLDPAPADPASIDRPAELVPVPDSGRVFRGHRRVRLGDVTPTGRLRLDALARYLQDVSNDDTRDAELPDAWGWLVRRTTIRVLEAPRLDDELLFETFCGGTGPRWAERRVRVTTGTGAEVDAATIWVCVDPDSGRPRQLSDDFHRIFTPTAAGRRVSARITHPDPPVDGPARRAQPWQVRAADLDVLGHVNNAVSWACVEEVLACSDDPDRAMTVEVGFHRAVEPDDPVILQWSDHGAGRVDLWLTGPDGLHTSAVIRPA